jgi:polyisoprenoid-binding protein YceI
MHRLVLYRLGAGAWLAAASLALAAPAAMPEPNRDPAKTESGTYALDGSHVGLQAKIGHGGGVSWSVFRFDKVSGSLDWNAENPAASRITILVDPRTIQAASPEFGPELAGESFLNTAQYPEAKFVSTSARQTGPGRGQVTGELTFYGRTRPITFDVTFIGSESNARSSGIGLNAIGRFKRSDFGYTTMMGPIGDEVILELDAEFRMARPPAAIPAA